MARHATWGSGVWQSAEFCCWANARTAPSVWHVSKMTRTSGVPAARHDSGQSQQPAWKNMKALAWTLLQQTVNVINTALRDFNAQTHRLESDCAKGPFKHHLTFCHPRNIEFIYIHNNMQENHIQDIKRFLHVDIKSKKGSWAKI